MTSPFPPEQQPPLPGVSAPDKYGIAVIGAGAIVNSAHLPAYRRMGYRVCGIYDVDQERARRTAGDFAINRVYQSLEDLLADEEVQVVDIAVPPWAQQDMLLQIARAGRHLLCQKPLAERSEDAASLAAAAREAGVHLAVNVNMRWSPAVRVLRSLVERGMFGDLTRFAVEVNFWDTWETWPWLKDVDGLLVLYDAIHLIDALRFVFGEAESVYATASRLPWEEVKGETEVLLVFRYTNGLTACIHDSAHNWAKDTLAEFRVEGTDGAAKGILGVWYDYPVGRPDRIEYCPRRDAGRWTAHEPPGRWVPDAWAWTMAELLESIDADRPPANSGEDHVRTLEYVEAAYRSIATGQVVPLPGRPGQLIEAR